MSRYSLRFLGYGDNVVDKYEDQKIMYPGGNAVNFSVYAKRLGVEKSAYMGLFGTDREAEHVIASLQQEGVELIKCRQEIGENGCAYTKIVDNDRVFLHSNNGGIRREARYPLSPFDLEYVAQFDLVHTGNYSYTETQLEKIKKAKVPISFDFSDDSDERYLSKHARNVDLAFISCGKESKENIKEKLQWIRDLGPRLVCATRGAQGCIAYDGAVFYEQPAHFTPDVVDTMGAGDGFLTAFLVHYLSRLKDGADQKAAIAQSLKDAARFSAKVCEDHGSWGHPALYTDEKAFQ